MQKGGVAQGSRRKNGSLNIQKQGRTWSDEIASNWWGGRAVVDCLFSCAVVIRTACKLICCSYRNKTNLNKNAFCFFMYFLLDGEKYQRHMFPCYFPQPRRFLNVDVVSIQACFSAA